MCSVDGIKLGEEHTAVGETPMQWLRPETDILDSETGPCCIDTSSIVFWWRVRAHEEEDSNYVCPAVPLDHIDAHNNLVRFHSLLLEA